MTDTEAKRKAAIEKIDAEVSRLRRLASEKQRAVDEDEKKHPLDQDERTQRRLWSEVGNITTAVDALLVRRNEIEIGVAEKPVERIIQAPYKPYDPGLLKPEDLTGDPEAAQAIGEVNKHLADVLRHFTEEQISRPPTLRFVMQLVMTQVGVLRRRDEEIDTLTKRMAGLEQSAMRYLGVWKCEMAYGTGAAVTDRGSSWFAQHPTTERPGTSDAWKLVVKQGAMR